MERVEAERLISLDESGVTTEMTRRYGRALGSALRATKARTLETLEQAMADALTTVIAQDAANCFRHCGYGLR